jgi:PIN domain nuclease of toxin-antitoxin system
VGARLKLLLDTCTFIWLCSEPAKLSPRAKRTMGHAEASLFLSDVSVWEICLKWRARKLRLPSTPRQWAEEQTRQWAIRSMPIERRHLYRTTELDDIHPDPFDRTLIAQAIEEDCRLVTPDAQIAKYPVSIVW